MESMDLFKKLTSIHSFNVFVGAGISRNSPANAPVWREFQQKFIFDLFNRIEQERWFPTKWVEKEKTVLLNHSFRPEQFWEIMQVHTSLELVTNCLESLNQGKSNLCHMVLSRCFENNIISNIITTNFDEYIEKASSNLSNIIIDSSDIKKFQICSTSKKSENVLFKIHGSLSNLPPGLSLSV